MIRIGVLGTGNISKVHAKHLRKRNDIELFAYNLHNDHLDDFVQQFQAIPCSSEEELIQKVDAIIICTPTDCHKTACLKSIAQGLGIFIEKPMALNVQDCMDMHEAAEKANVLLVPGHVVRYFIEFEKGREAKSLGKLGDVFIARTRRGGLTPKGSDNWFMHYERSGGVLLDLAIHDFDWLRWTLGEIRQIYSSSFLGKFSDGDYALTTLEFDSGVIAHIESTWMDPAGFKATYELIGNKGKVSYDSKDHPIPQYYSSDGSASALNLEGGEDPYFKQINCFIDTLFYGKKTLQVNALDGLMAVSIAITAIESAKTGKQMVPARFF